jgi:hypothetical protein
MLRVSKVHKSTLRIDGEPVKLVLKKLAQDEFTLFTHEFERLGKVHNAEQLELRPRADEDGLTQEQIEAKRYHAMPLEQRAEFDKRDLEEAARSNEWAREAIRACVTTGPGRSTTRTRTEDHLGRGPGAALRQPARRPADLVAEVFLMNRLSEMDKKNCGCCALSAFLDRSGRNHWTATGTDCGKCRQRNLCEQRGCVGGLDQHLSGSTAP